MIITPSEFLSAHLKEQNVTAPEGGFLVSDEEYKSASDLLAQSHGDESPEAFKDRVDYFVIWQNYGVQQNGGATGGELAVGQRIATVAHRVAQLTEVHLPKLAADLSEGVALAKDAVKEGHDKVEAAIRDLKTFQDKSHAEVIKVKSELHAELKEVATRYGKLIVGALFGILFMLILIALLSHPAHGQSTVVRGASKGTTTGAPVTSSSVDANHTALDVNIAAGGGTGGGPSDAAPNAAASESDTARQKVSTTLRLYDTGSGAGSQLVTARGDQTSGLWVNCKTGCAGGATTPSDAFANPTTAGLSMVFPGMWNGATWDRMRGDTTSGLWVNCKNGCAGGSSTPADTFSNPTTAGLGMSFPMLWNGTSWDRWYGDKTNGAFVNIKNASIAVTGTFWQATQPVSGTFWQATQPVSGTFWQATQPVSISGNQAVNVAQINGITPLMGNGITGTGSQRVTIASDNTAFAVNATLSAETTKVIGTVNIAAAQAVGLVAGTALVGKVGIDQTTPGTTNGVQVNAALPAGTNLMGKVGIDQTTPGTTNGVQDAATSSTGAAVPAKAGMVGGTDGTNLVAFYVDPCQRGAHTVQLVNLTASATLITGTAAKNVYICDLNIVSASADNIALVEGTGTVCATGIAGMAGGTTAATGWNFAANGGMTLGNGAASVLNTATAADNVCILVSGATQVSGSFHYVKF